MKRKQLSMKKLYILAIRFLQDRYKDNPKKFNKKELEYLKGYLDYIWKHKGEDL